MPRSWPCRLQAPQSFHQRCWTERKHPHCSLPHPLLHSQKHWRRNQIETTEWRCNQEEGPVYLKEEESQSYRPHLSCWTADRRWCLHTAPPFRSFDAAVPVQQQRRREEDHHLGYFPQPRHSREECQLVHRRHLQHQRPQHWWHPGLLLIF